MQDKKEPKQRKRQHKKLFQIIDTQTGHIIYETGTQKDVAKFLGVSQPTVSDALNKKILTLLEGKVRLCVKDNPLYQQEELWIKQNASKYSSVRELSEAFAEIFQPISQKKMVSRIEAIETSQAVENLSLNKGTERKITHRQKTQGLEYIEKLRQEVREETAQWKKEAMFAEDHRPREIMPYSHPHFCWVSNEERLKERKRLCKRTY